MGLDLVSLLVVVLIMAVVFYILKITPIDQPFKNIAFLIVAVIFIVYLLRSLGMVHI